MTTTAPAEFVSKAFDQVFENFRKATESTTKLQEEMLQQWTTAWPGFPKPTATPFDKMQPMYKEWTKTFAEITRKQQEVWDRQYKAGMESLEKSMRLAETQDPAEFREKMLELWQKSFDCLKELAQTQAQTFQGAFEKWMELAKKATP